MPVAEVDDDIEIAVAETRAAVAYGADEVDVVFPWRALQAGNAELGRELVSACKAACGDKLLKVFIESGELATPALIRQASDIALAAGADFLKTSTGKVAVNATLEAAAIMLQAIRRWPPKPHPPSRLPAERYRVGKDVADPAAILVRSADLHAMAIPASVRAIGRAGAGTNNIPVKAMSARGVPVFNAPGANANAVKELVIAGTHTQEVIGLINDDSSEVGSVHLGVVHKVGEHIR